MYLNIFPDFDTTLYEFEPDRNTGVDQILELSKFAINSKSSDGVYWDNTYNSRILLKFNLGELSSSINSGKIPGTAKYYLKLYVANSTDIPVNHSIDIHPVYQTWVNGNGTAHDKYVVKNGASWNYRNAFGDGNWNTGSGVEVAYQTTYGGGSYYTSSLYTCTASFGYDNLDMRVDVTKIVKGWLSGSYENNGFMIKRSNSDESGSSVMGTISYFSKDTHTIYVPRLEVMWDDSDLSGVGSLTEIGENYIISSKNFKPAYNTFSKAKIRFKARDRYPTKTYSTSSAYEIIKRLPTSSYYSILDYATNDTIIPFDDIGTRISCDSNGNYIYVDMNAFFPERYYYLIIKVIREGGDIVDIENNSFMFKVTR